MPQTQQLVEIRQLFPFLAVSGNQGDDLPFRQSLITVCHPQQRIHTFEFRQFSGKQYNVFPAVRQTQRVKKRFSVYFFRIEDVLVIAVGQQQQLVRAGGQHGKGKIPVVL